MPAKPININLLGQTDLEHTPYGRIVSWAVTYGRYIMVGTEIVVLLAFISRFSLDRKLTDLKEEIAQKQAILEANLPFETEFRNLQSRLSTIKTLSKEQSKPAQIMNFIQSILPPDVYLESFEFISGNLKVSVVAGTTEGFSRFLADLETSRQLSKIEIGDVKKTALRGIEFQFTAKTGAGKSK